MPHIKQIENNIDIYKNSDIVLNMNLTKPENNLVAKLTNDYGVVVNEKYTVAVNALNGATVNTSALVAALIKFTQIAYTSYEIYGRMSYKNKPVSIQTYDRVRYLVLKLDNKAYAEVLD